MYSFFGIGVITPAVRNIVRHVFREHQNVVGLDSHEIYNFAKQLYPPDPNAPPKPAPQPPAPPPQGKGKKHYMKIVLPPKPEENHPLHSMRYLKKIVLEGMAADGELEKVAIRRVDTTDKNGQKVVVMKTKKEGIVPIPPDRLPPRAAHQKLFWVWRYQAPPEQLDVKETELPQHQPLINLRRELTSAGYMDMDGFFDDVIKFVDFSPTAFRKLLDEMKESTVREANGIAPPSPPQGHQLDISPKAKATAPPPDEFNPYGMRGERKPSRAPREFGFRGSTSPSRDDRSYQSRSM